MKANKFIAISLLTIVGLIVVNSQVTKDFMHYLFPYKVNQTFEFQDNLLTVTEFRRIEYPQNMPEGCIRTAYNEDSLLNLTITLKKTYKTTIDPTASVYSFNIISDKHEENNPYNFIGSSGIYNPKVLPKCFPSTIKYNLSPEGFYMINPTQDQDIHLLYYVDKDDKNFTLVLTESADWGGGMFSPTFKHNKFVKLEI